MQYATRHRLLVRLGALACVCAAAGVWPNIVSGADPEAAQFALRTWDRRDGLPGVEICDIQRTPNGYLWLATPRGLLRFDGTRFKTFDAENTPAFTTNDVTRLLVEPDGALWVGTVNETCRFPTSPRAGKFDEIGTDVGTIGFAQGAGDTMWAISSRRDQLFQIVGRNLQAQFAVERPQIIRAVVWNERLGVVAAIDHDLYSLTNGTLVPWPASAAGKLTAVAITRASQGGLWVSSGTEVTRLNAAGRIDSPSRLADAREAPQVPISSLLEDRSGRLWAGTRNGSVHYFRAETGWQQVTPKRSRWLGGISCIYEDFEGVIWAGTRLGLLHQIKPRVVSTWSLPGVPEESVPQTVCATRDGSVWIGTDGSGAYQYRNGLYSRLDARHGLSNATVLAIYEDRQTNLWLGTLGGLFRLVGDRVEPVLESVVRGQPVPAIFEDRAGKLWIGTVGAVIRMDGDTARVFELEESLRNSEVRALAEGPKGEIWIGPRGGGLLRLENERIKRDPSFTFRSAGAIHCDKRGVLWVATAARGLVRYYNGRVLGNWGIQAGLPSNMLFAILEDAGGTLWISSSDGVFGLNKRELLEYERGKSAPLVPIHLTLPDTEYWSAGSGQPAASVGPDGRLWFPLAHGVLSFNPKLLLRERPAFPVMIEELLVDGTEQDINSAQPLHIPSGARRLEFHYTVADLDAPAPLRFHYKLEGQDEEWVDAGPQRIAHYGRLQPGSYTFRVISAGSANVWTEVAAPLSFEIVPPLWETRWVRAMSALILFGVVAFTVHRIERNRTRRRLERLEMQQAMEKERRRIARDLHDDLGAGLTEIMLLGELARRNLPSEAQPEVVAMTEKSRQLATAMDEVVWTVNPKNDFVPNLVSYICDYAREFCTATTVRCRIVVDENLPMVPVTAQTRHNLFLAVKEALNNAAKHSEAHEVWLRLRCDENSLYVTVEDNGRGFDPSAVASRGNGLQNMRTRLEATGGKTEIESHPGAGTQIRFSVPLHSGNGERKAGFQPGILHASPAAARKPQPTER
jgi:signal transduction histidine kinase/ligand-binding sensor domain-containing protein